MHEQRSTTDWELELRTNQIYKKYQRKKYYGLAITLGLGLLGYYCSTHNMPRLTGPITVLALPISIAYTGTNYIFERTGYYYGLSKIYAKIQLRLFKNYFNKSEK